MKKQAFWKWVFLAAFTLFSLYTVLPIKEKVRLGLDLAGGTSFTVQIDQEQLRSDMLAATPDRPLNEIDAEIAEIMKDADARTIEVLRNRVDALGVNEPIIAPAKDHRILIQLPGADEEQRDAAEKSIKSAAFLKFCLAHRDNTRLTANLFANAAGAGRMAHPRRALLIPRKYETLITIGLRPPSGTSFEERRRAVFMLQPEALGDGREVYTPCFVSAFRLDEMLKRADIGRDPMTSPCMSRSPSPPPLFAKISQAR